MKRYFDFEGAILKEIECKIICKDNLDIDLLTGAISSYFKLLKYENKGNIVEAFVNNKEVGNYD